MSDVIISESIMEINFINMSSISETTTQFMESVLNQMPNFPSFPELSSEDISTFVEEALVILSNINTYWTNLFGVAVTLLPDQLEPLYIFSAGK